MLRGVLQAWQCLSVHAKFSATGRTASPEERTRSSAVAEKPRDAPYHEFLFAFSSKHIYRASFPSYSEFLAYVIAYDLQQSSNFGMSNGFQFSSTHIGSYQTKIHSHSFVTLFLNITNPNLTHYVNPAVPLSHAKSFFGYELAWYELYTSLFARRQQQQIKVKAKQTQLTGE